MAKREKGNGFFNRDRETMDPDDRKGRQNKGFLDIFRHAFRNSRVYRANFQKAGIDESGIRGLEDIEKLPLLPMAELVERQKQDPPFGGFETIDPGDMGRIYANPGLIWQPGARDYKDTTWAEAMSAAGFWAGDRIVNTFNYHMWPLAFMLDASAGMIGATVVPTGIGNTLMQVRIIQGLKATGYMGTPGFIMTLIQRAEHMGLDVRKDLSLETALVGAEMLPESLRSRIEEKTGMRVRQFYGTVFLGCIGYECLHLGGLHVPEDIIVEVVDPQTGRQAEPGAIGEIVATSFNASYPMIRMATGDLSLLTHESCPCGRTGLVLQKILGRIDQAVKVRGTFVHPWQTDEVISHHPEVYKYQVVITRDEHRSVMTFVVELKEDVTRSEIIGARIERDIKDILTIKGQVDVVPRGTIPDLHKKIEDRRSWE